MSQLQGTAREGLFGATLGFFVGFAAVALFGPTASQFQAVMGFGPTALGFLVAMPALSGSLLRIPIAGMLGLSLLIYLLYPDHLSPSLYPLLLLLGLLSGCGIATFSVGISQVSYWFPQKRQGRALAIFGGVGNLAPGIFSLLLPFALIALGLAGSYFVWLAFLVVGTILYALFGRNAWYFQLRDQGVAPDQARQMAAEHGQSLFPSANLVDSLRISARVWRTWALVGIYFTTFGGFIALTAWLPTYWKSAFGLSVVKAGLLTALFSILASVIRILGGVLSDHLREGGENTAILALFIMMAGALVMVNAHQYELAIPGEILLAVGMGICNAAVFKLVPQEVPQAVGGAAGWIGGLGAFGGFVIPPIMGFAVRDLGQPGYAIGFVTMIFLSLFSLSLAWILKYTRETPLPVPAAAKGLAGGKVIRK
ncbi:MAG: MFS transporter [Acidobacteria bacterium]|nr:MFS transporter [Acidobacteriota bacterium]